MNILMKLSRASVPHLPYALLPLSLLCFLAAFLGGCKDEVSDEDQIRAVLTSIEEGIENQNLPGVLENVHDTYKDSSGDKNALKGKLFMVQRRGRVTIGHIVREIAVDGNRATASVQALAMQGQHPTIIPERADEFLFEVTLTKEDKWTVSALKRIRGSAEAPG